MGKRFRAEYNQAQPDDIHIIPGRIRFGGEPD
jgi:hypothetical protein